MDAWRRWVGVKWVGCERCGRREDFPACCKYKFKLYDQIRSYSVTGGECL